MSETMNTAIGVEKYTDMGEGLAGGIAGLRGSPRRSTPSAMLWLSSLQAAPDADSLEPTFGVTLRSHYGNYTASSNRSVSLLSAAVMQKPVPKPGPGEVLVRVQLRPINPADVMSLAGVLRMLRL